MKSLLKSYNLLLITPCLVLFLYGNAIGADRLVYMGSSVIFRTFLMDAGKMFKDETGTRIVANAGLANQGIVGLLDGKCDIAGGGRPLKADEIDKGLHETPFASNNIAVFVNKNNPVDNLSSPQIKDIFSGKITNWKEVGGADKPILLVIDPPKSLHRKSFNRIIMKDVPFSGTTLSVKKPPETVGKVARFQYSISYTSLGLVAKNPGVKPIAIDGIQPVADNIANYSYGLSMTMYFYTMGKPEGKIKDLIDFLKSAQGRNFISIGGMHPLTTFDH